MHKTIVVCIVLTIAVACFYALYVANTIVPDRSPPADHPLLVLDHDRWDFGDVRPGATLVTHFPIRNVGHRRLIVRRRTSSCECASGNQATIIVQPGESTKITATLDTNDLRGGQRMELDFTTSAPNLPKFRLTLLADVDQTQTPETPSGDASTMSSILAAQPTPGPTEADDRLADATP